MIFTLGFERKVGKMLHSKRWQLVLLILSFTIIYLYCFFYSLTCFLTAIIFTILLLPAGNYKIVNKDQYLKKLIGSVSISFLFFILYFTHSGDQQFSLLINTVFILPFILLPRLIYMYFFN
jgi:hypothetical protein